MARHDIIVIGASAGSGEALHPFSPLLPADLRFALFVVLHRAYFEGEYRRIDPFAYILKRTTKLTMVAASDDGVWRR